MPKQFKQFWQVKKTIPSLNDEKHLNKEGLGEEWQQFLSAVQNKTAKDFPDLKIKSHS